MNRWKAFALHLLLSLVLISGIAATALLTWYPWGLYRISGLDRLLVVMLCIDIVAGPLLTLMIYKPGKPHLRLDLSVIALVQACFLAYGLHTLWQSRPVFLVASDVRFDLVLASDLDESQVAAAPRPEWRRLSWSGPRLVGVLPPEDSAERQRLLAILLETGRDLHQLPEQYLPFEQVRDRILANAKNQPGGDREPALPVMSRFGEARMLIDPATAMPLRVLPPA